jgi:predicted O-linked N-acetylglucosamine transferase (SPINDLY family)
MYTGVPVITLFDNKNNYHVHNVSSSIMINSGMPEYVCMTEDEYVEKVVYYANNLEELRGLKQKVHKKFTDTICNYSRFTNEFEDKLLHLWIF